MFDDITPEEVCDSWGSVVTVSRVPGLDIDTPELILVHIQDENALAIAHLTPDQARALIDALHAAGA